MRETTMLKKWNLVALILSAVLVAPAIAVEKKTERPEIANNVEAYSGRQNVQVWTLRVGKRSANQALVQITGIDHDWDKRIQKMDIEKTFKDVRYSVDVNGKRYVALIVNNGLGELYLPGENKQLEVFSDSTLASEGNAEHFLTEYLQQSEGL
jgi:hypothetical protein